MMTAGLVPAAFLHLREFAVYYSEFGKTVRYNYYIFSIFLASILLDGAYYMW